MKTRLAAMMCLALTVAQGCATTPSPSRAAAPERIEFSLPKLDGTRVELASLRGKVVLVDVWATWCAPCKASFPFYSRLQDQYRERGFEVLAVSVDEDAAAVPEFVEANPVTFTVLHDPAGTLPAQLDLDTMPTAVLVGRDGAVLYLHAGFVSGDEAELEARVSAALEAS